MEDQSDPLSNTISESIDIKVEEVSDCVEDYAEPESNSNEQQDIVQVNVKCENDNIPLGRSKKSKERSVDYKWTCNLCTKTGTSVTDFKRHLSYVHYREELMTLWPGGPTEPCPYCQRCLFSDPSKVLPSRATQIIAYHLGSAHNFILQYLDDTLKSEIGKFTPRPLSLENVTDEEKFDCFVCLSKCKSFRYMKLHLGWIHYGETILQESGSTNDRCGLCEFNLTGKKHSRTRDIVTHLIGKHYYLYRVVPEEVAQKLLQLDKTGTEQKEFDMSRGLIQDGQYQCPYCKLPLKAYESVVKHVVQQHLLNDILTMSGCVDTDSCKFCGRIFTTSNRETFQQKLVCHLASMHGYLEKTLTVEAKCELAKLKETLRKNGVSLRNRPHKATKIEPVKQPKKKKRKTLPKPCQDGKEALSGQGILMERLAAFEDARTNGVLKCEPNVGATPGYEERTKCFQRGPKPDDWQCFLCEQTGINIHQLKTHLATRHLGKLLRFFWPYENFDHTCPYCYKPVFKKPSLQAGIKEYCAIAHLAKQHELIKHVASEDVKKALEEFEKALLFYCPLCQESCKTMASLESHLILEHYKYDIRIASKSSGVVCGICKEQFGDKRSMLVHVARKHDLVKKVFDKDVLDYMAKFDTGTAVKEEVCEYQEDVMMNFVDVDSVEVKAEPQETAEQSKDSLEIVVDKLTSKKKKIQNEDGELFDLDMSDIIVTDSSIGSLS